LVRVFGNGLSDLVRGVSPAAIIAKNSSVQRYDDAMVAVVMTVDVAFFLHRHWIKFVGMFSWVELAILPVPSGNGCEG